MPFCAHCTNEATDLELVDYDGRQVQMCGDCREGSLRDGRYSFGGGCDYRLSVNSGNSRRGFGGGKRLI